MSAACSGSRDPVARGARSRTTVASRTTAASSDPTEDALQLLLPDPTGARLLARAFDREQAATTRCIRAAGFRSDPAGGAALASAIVGRAPDLGRRATVGYALAGAGDSPDDRYARSLTGARARRYSFVVFGPPGDLGRATSIGNITLTYPRSGCLATGRRLTFGRVTEWADITTFPQGYRIAAHGLFVASDPYRAALAAWRTCMARRGSPEASPDAAVRSLQRRYASGADDAATAALERVVAVADGRCQVRSGMTRAQERTFRSYLATLDAGTVARLARAWHAVVAAAAH